jgi:hypothetical protein
MCYSQKFFALHPCNLREACYNGGMKNKKAFIYGFVAYLFLPVIKLALLHLHNLLSFIPEIY